MKTYIIKLSRSFLKGHPRSGEPTYFVEKFLKGQEMYSAEIDEEFGRLLFSKIHTIRGNYSYWEKRIQEIQEGKAILRVQYWSGIPFRNKAITICDLTAADGVGIQKLRSMDEAHGFIPNKNGNVIGVDLRTIANNDGLSTEDFKAWFANSKPTPADPFAIIHFTKYRY